MLIFPDIKDSYRKNVTAILLENQEKALREEANVSGVDQVFSDTSGNFNSVSGFNPVLISLVRRSMPNLIAYDVCGVQPMSGPTGLIFAMKARFTGQANSGNTSPEALNEAPTGATTGGDGATTGVGFPTFGGTGDPLGGYGTPTGGSVGAGATSTTLDIAPGAPTSFLKATKHSTKWRSSLTVSPLLPRPVR